MKRLIDVVVSTLAILILCPVFLTVSIVILITMGGPILFKQLRPGLKSELFQMIKFRTMIEAHDNNGVSLPDADRTTYFGGFLRHSSLDELPELWNVLKGDMSLVGPRPLLVEYLPLYNKEQVGRHSVKPGITGWAQVNGRNAIDWNQKFELDNWYVDNQSTWLDIKILFLTLYKVIKRDGISFPDDIVQVKFTGNPDHRRNL